MKIAEVIAENLNAGPGGVSVGNAGAETAMLKPEKPIRRLPKPPQVGYGIKIGNKVIPTPGYNPGNDLGQVNKVVGG